MKIFKNACIISLCLIWIVGGSALCADEVTDLMLKAEKAYTAKNYNYSVKYLNQAAHKIQDILAEKLAAFLPKEIEGWKRGEAKKETLGDASGQYILFSGFFSAHVNYRKADGPEKVKVTITNAPQLTQMARIPMELFKNPFFKQMAEKEDQSEKIDPFTIQGIEGYKRAAEDANESDIFLFEGNVMLQVQGQGIGDPQRLEKFIKNSDLQGLKQFSAPE